MMSQPLARKSAYILIVEDDDLVARTIDRSLRTNEFKTALATNGDEGLRMARKRLPDLVILDIIMPGLDGYEVCHAMRADSHLANVPVLFLTAKIKDEDRINGFLAGADDYLTKPFNLDELLLRVRAILRRTQSPHALRPSATLPAGVKLSPQARKIIEQIRSRPGNTAPPLVAGDFVLDTQSFELYTRKRGKIRLTPSNTTWSIT